MRKGTGFGKHFIIVIMLLLFSIPLFVFAENYSVEFTNGDVQYSIAGGNQIYLSELLKFLGCQIEVQDVVSVSFSDDTLISIKDIGDDWLMTTLRPFSSVEELTLILMDGKTLQIKVTDDETPHYDDLSKLLKNFILYVDGEEVHDGDTVDVRDGMLYDLVLTFQEDNTKQFSDDKQLYFQMPTNFVLPDGFTDTLTINLGIDGKVYGNKLTYDKETNRLLLDWNTEDRKFSRMTDAGNLRFTVRVQGYINPGEVSYGDSFHIIANRYDPHNASVSKTGILNRDDLEHQKITYTVIVKSDGSTENLILTDVMGNALTYSDDPVTWSRISLMASQADARRVETTPVSTETSSDYPSLQYAAEGLVISIPETHDGDLLTFTYSADVDYTKITHSGSASFDEMGNTVQIFGDSDPIDNTSVWHQKDVYYSDLTKNVSDPSARYKENDHEYQDITWTIDTNKAKMVSFRGTEITDILTEWDGSGENAANSVPVKYTGEGITIDVYQWNADKTDREFVEKREILWSDLSTSEDLDPMKGWIYQVPEDDGIYEYHITYKTQADVTGLEKDVTLRNQAESFGGNDIANVLLHPKGTGLGINKKVISYTREETTWEITVTLDDIADGYNGRLVLTDVLPTIWSDVMKPSPRRDTYKDGTLEIEGLKETEGYQVYYSEYSVSSKDKTPMDGNSAYTNWTLRNQKRYHIDGQVDKDGKQVYPIDDGGRNVIYIWFYQDTDCKTEGLQAPESGDSRTLRIRLTTKNNPDWTKDAWNASSITSSYTLRHQNNAYINTSHELAEIVIPGEHLYKSYKQTGNEPWIANSITHISNQGGDAYFKFETYVSGAEAGEDIVIEDTFDTSLFMLLQPNTADQHFRAGNQPHYASATMWSPGDRDSYVELTETGVRFHLGNLPLKANGSPYEFYGVEYRLVIKDREAFEKIQKLAYEAGGIARFINSASYKEMTDKDTFTVEISPEYKPILKSDPIDVQDVDDMVEYTITLNQRKQRLNDGNPITMEDEFDEHLSIDYSSITIATDPAGREAEVSYDYSGKIGTFLIPDETKVTITYQARVIPDKDAEWTDNKTEVTVYNVAYMLGWKDGGTREITVTKGGDAEIWRIRLFKYGSGHMESGLNDATFGLYEKVGDDYVPMLYQAGASKGERITFSTTTVSMLNGIIQTGSDIEKLTEAEKKQLITRDGYALVELSQREDGVTLLKEKTYYLKEETVPDNYEKDSSVEYYSFTFNDTPEYAEGGWIYYNNDILKVRNSPTDGSFSIKKKIDGNYSLSDGQLDSLRFTVQKKVEDDWEDITILTYTQIKDGYIIDHISAGTYRIVETLVENGVAIPGSVDHTISFTIDEIEEDLTEYVQFEITDADIANGIEHTIEITDAYTQETITLRAQKSWLDAENLPRVPEGASVKLGVYVLINGRPEDQPLQTVELDGTPDVNSAIVTGESAAWIAQFAGLPKKDDDGNDIKYVVKEIEGVTGYQVDYDGGTEWLELRTDSTVKVTNKQETVSFTVSKYWSAVQPDKASITIGIYYGLTEAEAFGKYQNGAKPYKTARLPDENTWTATFDSLPKADGIGNEYVWIAVETVGQPGFDASYPDDKDYLVLTNDSTKQQMITNGPRPVVVDIQGEKQLIGKKLEDQEFAFLLSPEHSEAQRYGIDVYPGGFTKLGGTLEAANNADGRFAFHLVFTAEDYVNAKTFGVNENGQRCAYFFYVVEEQIPDEPAEYVEYDTGKFLVRVELRPDMTYEIKIYHYTDAIPDEAKPETKTQNLLAFNTKEERFP